jgi:beta-lactam-binding protein with PASTA domain
MLHTVYRSRCDARVVYQKPAAGTYVPLHAPTTIRLRLVRTPRLVGLNVCDAKAVVARQGLHILKSSPPDETKISLPANSMCKNVVLSQRPAVGQVVRRPVTVVIRVSKLRNSGSR